MTFKNWCDREKLLQISKRIKNHLKIQNNVYLIGEKNVKKENGNMS